MESFFSMSGLDNGINVVTMSIMYMAFQSSAIHGKQREDTDDMLIYTRSNWRISIYCLEQT